MVELVYKISCVLLKDGRAVWHTSLNVIINFALGQHITSQTTLLFRPGEAQMFGSFLMELYFSDSNNVECDFYQINGIHFIF